MTEPPKPPDDLPDFETICAHWGEDREQYSGAVIPPIYQNSLFTAPSCEARYQAAVLSPERGVNGAVSGVRYDYTRVSNPTTDVVEAKITALEGGERARCFGSGMAAISGAILSCVKAGDHVVAVETIYGPTRQFLSDYLKRFDVAVTYVEGSATEQFADALQPNTTLIYLESPSSVVMKQQDIAAVAALAKERGLVTICDNSWASPYFQNPLKMGMDLVVHSATKYLGGHSDIVAGVAVGSEERMKPLLYNEGLLLGAILDPFASWLMLRGLRTLALRMERHQETARRIAQSLLAHPAVECVFYPGLSTDPQPELTCRQLRGTSGLFSFGLKQNSREAHTRFVDALHYFGIGCSWGGFESLALPMAVKSSVLGGRSDTLRWLVRLHIGLESADDLWDDIAAALDTGRV